MASKTVKIGNKSIILNYKEFEEEIDLDDILRISYDQLLGEIITFPIILNRLGLLLADAEQTMAEKKLLLETTEAKRKEQFRDEWDGAKSPTVDQLNSMLIVDKAYQVIKKSHIEAIKVRDYISSVYWAAKDKSAKLDKLSMSIQPSDITEEQLQGKINGVAVRISNKKNLID